MTEVITTTLTITMAMVLNMQECHCDGLCGVGPSGAEGAYQILSFGQMEKLGYPKDDSLWWMDWELAQPAVQDFLWWLEDTIPCTDPRWTYAAWNWGIGNVLRHIEKHGCDIDTLPRHVRSFANLERGFMCYETRRDEWSPMTIEEEECNDTQNTSDQRIQNFKSSWTTSLRRMASLKISFRLRLTRMTVRVQSAWIGGPDVAQKTKREKSLALSAKRRLKSIAWSID